MTRYLIHPGPLDSGAYKVLMENLKCPRCKATTKRLQGRVDVRFDPRDGERRSDGIEDLTCENGHFMEIESLMPTPATHVSVVALVDDEPAPTSSADLIEIAGG